jgi:hypothetical protein
MLYLEDYLESKLFNDLEKLVDIDACLWLVYRFMPVLFIYLKKNP